MHVYVQMYTKTTFPLRDESVSGLLLGVLM